jgi:hypothetical protein
MKRRRFIFCFNEDDVMRTIRQVQLGRSMQALAAVTHSFHASRVTAVALLLAFLATISLGVSAMGDEEAEAPPKPRIENFQAFFDGIDQYSLFGEVVNCDNVEGIEVEFGGIFEGYSATVRDDGYFSVLVVHEEATGEIVTAKCTSHEGQESDTISIDLY